MQKLVIEFDQNNPEYLDALIVMLVSSIQLFELPQQIFKHLAKVEYVIQTVRAETGVEEIDPAKLISKGISVPHRQ